MTRRAKKARCRKLRSLIDQIEAAPVASRHEILRLSVLVTNQLEKLTRAKA